MRYMRPALVASFDLAALLGAVDGNFCSLPEICS